MSREIRLILYPLFAILCLGLFSFLLFPFDSLKGRIQSEIGKGLGVTVSVEKISPAPFSGVVLKKVTLGSGNRPPITLDRARIKLGLLPLLWGSRQIDLRIRVGKGTIEGSLETSEEETKLDLQLDSVDLGISRLVVPQNLPLAGEMGGEVSLELYATDPLRNSGKVALAVSALRVEEGGTVGGFPIPSLILAKGGKEKSEIRIQVERGNWEIQTLKLTGGDLEFQADGKVYAARKMENYRLSLKGSFAIAPGSEEKVSFLSLLEKEKTEGKYPFFITGRLSKPSIRIGNFKVPI